MAVDNQGNPIPDVSAPAVTGGSTLGDILAGVGGATVNRPALGAGIAQGQALAGLRTAQTEDALQKAMNARDEAQARQGLEQSIRALPGETDASAHFKATTMLSGFGNAQQAFDAFKLSQETANRGVLGDPNQLGSPAQTAAQQGVQGKVAEPVTIAPAYATLPGSPQPNVQISPIGAADIAEKNAQAHAANTRAAGPNQMDPDTANMVADFLRLNPASATNIRALTSFGGPAVIRAYMAQEGYGPAAAPAPGVVPPNQVHPGVGTPGVAPPAPGQPTVQPLQPGQTEHNAPQHTPPNGITPAPGVSLSEQAKIRNDFASGTGAKQATNLNTMSQHARLFDQVADQIGNGNFTPTNDINVLWQKTFGSPAPTNLKLVGDFLGREAVRATVNSGSGTGEERELQVNSGSSPEQLHGAAATLRSLAAAQLQSLDLRARRGGVDISQLLSPETQASFGFHSGGNRPVTAAPGLPSSADIDAELARRAGAQ